MKNGKERGKPGKVKCIVWIIEGFRSTADWKWSLTHLCLSPVEVWGWTAVIQECSTNCYYILWFPRLSTLDHFTSILWNEVSFMRNYLKTTQWCIYWAAPTTQIPWKHSSIGIFEANITTKQFGLTIRETSIESSGSVTVWHHCLALSTVCEYFPSYSMCSSPWRMQL